MTRTGKVSEGIRCVAERRHAHEPEAGIRGGFEKQGHTTIGRSTGPVTLRRCRTAVRQDIVMQQIPG